MIMEIIGFVYLIADLIGQVNYISMNIVNQSFPFQKME